MNSPRRSSAWIGVLWLATSLGCSSTKPRSSDGPFDAVHRTLAARGAQPQFASFTVKEVDSAYLRGFRERSAAHDELRELAFHGVFRRGAPEAAGAILVDEAFLARPFDPKPYAQYDVAAMVEFARLVKLRLHGVEDVRWFMHGEYDGLVEVRATADPTRIEFRRNKSGELAVVPWRVLVLDGDGVPVRAN